jgi:dihydrofolate synthase/folylpolyglutamate synthase
VPVGDAAAMVAALLRRFEALHPRVIDLALGRIERLLGRLGNPERRLPPVVHFAGTNGKGSTLAFCRAALEAAGRRVHAYTSPHLVRFNERIALAGAPIGDDALIEVLQEVEDANAGAAITFFEITTAAAFLAFARAGADILLLETGLGGRLDATNLVDRPRLSVITPVALDHQSYLGDTLALIAAEKAGILKPGVEAVIGPQPAEALAAIEAAAEAIGTPLRRCDVEWRVADADGAPRFEGARWRLPIDGLSLHGRHQVDNAGLALACLERLNDFGITEAHTREGLRTATWPGRLQPVPASALAKRLPAGWSLWVDGGHNPHAAAALAAWARGRGEPVHLVMGLLATKDPAGFLAPFAGAAASLTAVPVEGHDTADPAALAGIAGDAGIPAATAPTVGAAIGALAARGGPSATVLICGSLYLVGSVLADDDTG